MSKQRESFTLIELVIVVSTIIIFTGISIGYYTQYTEKTKLENATRRLGTALSLVRQQTVSGNSTMCAPQVGVTPAAAYYALVVNDPASYTIEPVCSRGTPKPAIYENETNIVFLTPVPPAPYPVVTFFPVTGGSVCNYIYLKSQALSGSNCRYVNISQSGGISEGVCTDCSSCPTCP